MTADSIIAFFCTHTGVEPSTIHDRDKNDKLWYTRYMIWHYLHYSQGMSATQLAAMFHRNRPSIFRGLRVFRDHIQLHKEIRDRYASIVAKLEDATKATPSENME